MDRNTCMVSIRTDWTVYDWLKSEDVILAKIAEHLKAVNQIYSTTIFQSSQGDSYKSINFKAARIKIDDSSTKMDHSNPYRDQYLGINKILDILSSEDFSRYCLGYLFTNRDFGGGVLGLAWVSSPGRSGGICDKQRVLKGGIAKSANTGLVSFTVYNRVVSSVVSHLTFAHELGHSMGSPHDESAVCVPGDHGSVLGNYIMFKHSTDGLMANNRKFSPCSIESIGNALKAKKDVCFVASSASVCGNQIIDPGEECDCGFKDTCAKIENNCCTPANDMNRTQGCKLMSGVDCSPTQGSCCTKNCRFFDHSHQCLGPTECHSAILCTGNSSACPNISSVAYRKQKCHSQTMSCVDGECIGSICLVHDELEECECVVNNQTGSRKELCHSCCRFKSGSGTCVGTDSASLSAFFSTSTIYQQPGTPCDNFKGYCDIFSNCRLVDEEGPLFRITSKLLNPSFYLKLFERVGDYWWAVALFAVATIATLLLFIKVFNVHKVPPQDVSSGPYPIPGARKVLDAVDRAIPKPIKERLSITQDEQPRHTRPTDNKRISSKYFSPLTSDPSYAEDLERKKQGMKLAPNYKKVYEFGNDMDGPSEAYSPYVSTMMTKTNALGQTASLSFSRNKSQA